MCSSAKSKLGKSNSLNGRGVLQPNCNRAPLLERRNSIALMISSSSTSNSRPLISNTTTSTKCSSVIINAKLALQSCDDQAATIADEPRLCKSHHHLLMNSTSTATAAGSIAAARREQVAILQEQRKMRIAHYGRTTIHNFKSGINRNPLPPQSHHTILTDHDPFSAEKRCSFITPNSDPVYVAYHDQEWGVPVHDDKLLFELLVLTGAQLGSDWTSVLRRRQDFRDAFAEFDVEIVSKFSEKKMTWISAEYCMDLSLVRGVVDNSKRILEIKKEFGSFDKYMWGFVNHKAIATQYKWGHKIPAKTSKSETISKDMVRRGFRVVGPTVIHSFMQAAGLTNDHLITCPRHSIIT